MAEKNGIIFKEVSAKTGVNIQEFFKEIAALLPEVSEPTSRSKVDAPVVNREEPQQPKQTIVLSKPQAPVRGNSDKKKGCC